MIWVVPTTRLIDSARPVGVTTYKGAGADLPLATRTVEHAAQELYKDERWRPWLLEEPEVWGVETFTKDALNVRVVALPALVHREHVGLELGELRGADECGRVDDVGRVALGVAMLHGLHVQHELRQGPVQPLDVGVGDGDGRQQALRADIKYLDAVLITHCHADHIFGLDDIRPFNFRQREAIHAFANPATAKAIRRVRREEQLA